jgi:hypothetical protein
MPDRIQYAVRKGFRWGRGRWSGLTTLLLGTLLGAFPLAVTGSGISGAMGRPALMARIYTSEVPSSTADDGLFVRMAVIIPPRAEVANVEAFMDVEDFGRSTDRWRPCNLDTGECEVEGGRVQGLRRLEYPDRGEVLLDFWNEHPVAPRFAKLRVTFRPQGNLRKTYVPRECWLRTECGYAGWMDLSIVNDSDLSGQDQ